MADADRGVRLVVRDLAPLIEALRGCTLDQFGEAAGGVSKGYLSLLVNGKRRTVPPAMGARIEDAAHAPRGSIFAMRRADAELLAPYSAERLAS